MGLASADGRTYESIAVLLTRTTSLRAFFVTVEQYVGREFRVVTFDSAHVTLAGSAVAPPAWDPGEFRAGSAEIVGIDTTGYSIRLVPDQKPFAQIAAKFGLAPPSSPYGITLCYALARIPLERTIEVVGSLERALRERMPFTVSWEFVERQKRPLASREPFGYERLDSRRGSV